MPAVAPMSGSWEEREMYISPRRPSSACAGVLAGLDFLVDASFCFFFFDFLEGRGRVLFVPEMVRAREE